MDNIICESAAHLLNLLIISMNVRRLPCNILRPICVIYSYGWDGAYWCCCCCHNAMFMMMMVITTVSTALARKHFCFVSLLFCGWQFQPHFSQSRRTFSSSFRIAPRACVCLFATQRFLAHIEGSLLTHFIPRKKAHKNLLKNKDYRLSWLLFSSSHCSSRSSAMECIVFECVVAWCVCVLFSSCLFSVYFKCISELSFCKLLIFFFAVRTQKPHD